MWKKQQQQQQQVRTQTCKDTPRHPPQTDLLLRAIGMDHVDVDAFVHQLMEKLPGSIDGLDKDQHRRQEALKSKQKQTKKKSVTSHQYFIASDANCGVSPYFFDDVPHGQQFSVLCPHKQQLLLHRVHRSVSEKMDNSFPRLFKCVQHKNYRAN